MNIIVTRFLVQTKGFLTPLLTLKPFAAIGRLFRIVCSIKSRNVVITGYADIGKRSELSAFGGGSIVLGDAFSCGTGCMLHAFGKIEVGTDTFFNRDSVVVSMSNIQIGSHCRFGERVSIRDHDHRFSSVTEEIAKQGYTEAPIVIGNNCWIGCNVVIVKGVTIGDGCIIGAGSVVTKSIPPNSIAAGVPARVLRNRQP